MSYSGAPSTACSPTKSSSKWNNSPRLEKAKTSKNSKNSLFVSTSPSKQKNPSATFFKNYSLTPAANRPTFNKDIAIVHESRIYKNLLTASQKKAQTKRDPILLNNNEPSVEFKSSIRRLKSADRMSPNMDECFRRSKATGEFNHIYNPRANTEEQQGIRTFRVLPSPCADEEYTRMRKARCTSTEGRRNPITEGDEKSAIFKRWRGAVEKVDEHQRLNDKKYLLSAERGCSPKGRVFRDMTLTLGDYDYGTESKYEKTMSMSPTRPMSAMEEKMRGYAKDTLTYQGSPNHRIEPVTGKVTSNQTMHTTQDEGHVKAFGRKITLKN